MLYLFFDSFVLPAVKKICVQRIARLGPLMVGHLGDAPDLVLVVRKAAVVPVVHNQKKVRAMLRQRQVRRVGHVVGHIEGHPWALLHSQLSTLDCTLATSRRRLSSQSRFLSILRTAEITVVWSLPLNRLAISGREQNVIFRAKYIAT